MGPKADRMPLFAFTLLMSVIWANPHPEVAPQEEKPSAKPTSQDGKSVREAAERAVEVARREYEKLESRPHDVYARAQLLKNDPTRIIEFVQKKIRYEPYLGLQRGPAAALVSGAGNALDKAFLLKELLGASGYEARIVRGTLDRDKAEALIKDWVSVLKNRPAGRFSGPFGLGEVKPKKLEELCKAVGVPAEEAGKVLKGDEQSRRDSWNDALAIASRDAEFLQSQLRAADPQIQERPVREDLIKAAQAYAWVQWRIKGADAWTDADPCGALAPGVKSEGELNPPQAADLFVLTLSLDRKAGEKREAAVVLKKEVPVYEALLNPVRFSITPTSAVLAAAEKLKTEGELLKLLQSYREFTAVLQVGDDASAAMVFDYEGRVSKPVSAMAKIGGGAGGAAKGAADLFGQKAEEVKGVLQSLTLELSVTRAGAPLWSQRRIILEEGGQAGWCPMLSWDLFFQTCELSPRFVRAMRLNHRILNQARVQAAYDWAESRDRAGLTKALETSGYDYPLDLLEFCVARQAFLSRQGDVGAWLHFERPNLFMSGRRVRIQEGASKPCLCYGMDIVDNGALVLKAAEGVSIDREKTAALGVFDTVLEQVWVTQRNPSEPVAGTSSFFERARALSRPIRLVGARDSKGLAEAGVPRSDVAWILENSGPKEYVLAADLAAAAHCGGVYAWWSVDPATGRAVGRISGGRGGAEAPVCAQDLSEETILNLITGSICGLAALSMAISGKEAMEIVGMLAWCAGEMVGGRVFHALGAPGWFGVVLTVAGFFHTMSEVAEGGEGSEGGEE